MPKAVYLVCENCQEETLHQVLKGKIGQKWRIDATFRCSKCHAVSKKSICKERTVKVPVVVSWIEDSVRRSIEMDEDEEVSVGSNFVIDNEPVLVTSIETKRGRVERAKGKEIGMLWTKKCSLVVLKISLNIGRRTMSYKMEVEPDKEFCVGDILQVGKIKGRIHSIKTRYGIVRREGVMVQADIILRMYGKVFTS